MRDEAELSEIIGEIYNAVLDHALWPALIGRVAAFCMAQAGCIIVVDSARQTSTIQWDYGLPVRHHDSAISRYIRLPATHAVLERASVGEVIHLSGVLSAERFGRARLSRHWLALNGWSDVLLVPIGRCGQTTTIIALARRDCHRVNEEDPIHLIAPHLVQALKISRPLMMRNTQVAGFEATFDRLKPGIFLLGRNGAVIQANQNGEAMLREGHILRVIGGELRLKDIAADQLIKGAIAEATGQCGRRNDQSAVGAQMILQNGERYVALLLPMQESSRRSNNSGFNAELALFVYPAELETASSLRLIAETYNLTPAEMRVLLAVVQIGGVPEAAEELGIARNTTRVLLQRVYNKTGVKRQADLAKLMASFSTPLA